MIEVSHLFYDYPDCRALDDISFSLPEQSITALVGPNGAGKTTLLRTIATLDEPLSGSIHVDGTDMLNEPRHIHRLLGYLPDHFGLYNNLSVRQCLLYAARSRGISEAQEDQAIHRAIAQVHLEDTLDKGAGTLSRGQRQRLALAQIIIHRPRVLLLDEPASGLDPEARGDLAALMTDLAASGMTLLISSHILAELETYCTAMLVLRQGRLVVHQSIGTQNHSSSAGHADHPPQQRILRLRLTSAQLEHSDALSRTLTDSGLQVLQQAGGVLQAQATLTDTQQAELLAQLLQQGFQLAEFSQYNQSLQERYMETVSAQTTTGAHP